MRCSGLGRWDRIRVPSPAAKTIAYAGITQYYHERPWPDRSADARPSLAPGRGLEPLFSEPKSAVLPLDDPGPTLVPFGPNDASTVSERAFDPCAVGDDAPTSLAYEACRGRGPMGSLIKKRRKRMRKKKHKKMLRRTRHQRRK